MSRTMAHRPVLDGLRGLAVVAVVAYHLRPSAVPGGFIGVDVFFVLSGFLVTSLLIKERDLHGRIDVRAFWVRRVRRLVPAVVVATVGAIAIARCFGGRSAARKFITSISPSTGSPDSSRTAAPCAVRQ